MPLSGCKTLRAMLDELTQLATEEAAAKADRKRAGIITREGRDTTLISIPWAGQWWLTGGQREVVRVLLDARVHSNCPDVYADRLLRAAGAPGRLQDLFAGTDILGRLIVPGGKPGTWRIVRGSDDEGDRTEDAEVRVEPCGDE